MKYEVNIEGDLTAPYVAVVSDEIVSKIFINNNPVAWKFFQFIL